MNKRFYNFGAYRLDTHNQRLLCGGETITLTLKEFELLFALVENAGDVVSKDALLDAVWKDVSVAEETLTRNVSWLRKKLGSGGDESFIETVPKRGYRFTAQVTTSDAPEIIIEDQTLTRIRIEETISTDFGIQKTDDEQIIEIQKPKTEVRRLNPQPAIRNPQLFRLALAFGIFGLAAISFIVYQNYFQKKSTKIVFAGRVVPFAGLPGIETMPAFSPDSKQIVFGWNGGEGEILDIYVKIIGGGEPIRLTNGKTNAHFPVFAPDGRSVAFFRSSPETSRIFSVSALGGAERKICDVQSGGTGFSFAPDGKTIATADRDAATSANGIFFIDVETGAKTRLTMPPENFNDNTPRFSPDGKRVVFIRSSSWENQDLFIVQTAGGEPRRLTTDGSQLFGLAWSADGERIIYSSTRGESSINLWQIHAAGGEEPELLLAGGNNPKTPVASPDGKSIAFIEAVHDTNIWRLKSEPPAISGGSDFKKFIASTRADHSPQISPDGNRIVFVSLRTGDAEVWTTAADGSNPLRLATGSSPRISPDGEFVAFTAFVSDRAEIQIVNVDGGAPRLIAAGSAQNDFPAWSADGHSIYFRSNRSGDYNLWRVAADGSGEAMQITKHGAYESFAAPDGKSFFYTKERDIIGLWRVSVNDNAETSDEIPVAEFADAGFRRSWTITGNGIFFVARAEQPPYKIKFYNFSTNQTSEIATTDKPPILDSPGLSATADGKTILYAQNDQNANSIMLAELGK